MTANRPTILFCSEQSIATIAIITRKL